MAEKVAQNAFYYENITLAEDVKKVKMRAGYYKLFFVLEGSFNLHCNGKEIYVNRYDYMALKPNCICTFRKKSKALRVFFVDVEESVLLQIVGLIGQDFAKYVGDNDRFFVSGDHNAKRKIFEFYTRILKHGDEDGLLCKLYALEIMTGIARSMHKCRFKEEIPKHIAEAVNGLRDTENLQKGIDYVKDKLNYSGAQVCRIFKKYYGKTPTQYVADLRVFTAYEMIIYTDTDFQTISEKVGFSSKSHFYAKIGETYGKTPQQLRNGKNR